MSKKSGHSNSDQVGRPTSGEAVDLSRSGPGASKRITRPSTVEIRFEIMRLTKSGVATDSDDDFELGIYTALEWVMGDRRTLKRPDK